MKNKKDQPEREKKVFEKKCIRSRKGEAGAWDHFD